MSWRGLNTSSYKIKQSDYTKVINYFNSNHENGTTTIANKFKLPYTYISYMIDFYLSRKANYMGVKVMDNNSEIR